MERLKIKGITASRMKANSFSLKHTLESGQFFRYNYADGWYYCQERDKVFKIRQKGNTLEFKGTTGKHIRKLFGLDDNYGKVIKALRKDATLKPIVEKWKGLRIMNRDKWETIINFQCSMMSNIPKIKKNMELISKYFGKKKYFEGKEVYTFPAPGEINSMAKLRKSSVGFRAKYIYSANKIIDAEFIKHLNKEKLMTIPGIGEKIADCVCLFALGQKNAFPTDVWIERVMKQKYRIEPKQIQEFAKKWGEYAGYAQQFLYHDARNR
ncbi:hypothetical protein KY329_00140 [Candidatus Woesearchaeota archaeon]|nr:hypothetical protein [Candidatus Woesearchaeota archaeon]